MVETEEFIKTLRTEAQFQSNRFRREILASELNNAADMIESMHSKLAAKDVEIANVEKKYRELLTHCMMETMKEVGKKAKEV